MVEGSGANKVLLLFDSAAERTHWKLDNLLKRAGLVRENFLLMDSQNRTEVDLVRAARGIRMVVPMGPGATATMLMHIEVERWMLRVIRFSDGSGVMPLLAPSQLLVRRGAVAAPEDGTDADALRASVYTAAGRVLNNPPRFTGLMILGLRKAIRYAELGLPEEPRTNYLLNPDPTTFKAWDRYALEALATGESPGLSVDIETDYHIKQRDKEDQDEGVDQDSKITRWSFSYRPHEAVSIPESGEYRETVLALLSSPFTKITWNGWAFDQPVIERNGWPFNGPHFDAQDAFHVWQSDLPKGLEPVTAIFTQLKPWKHLADSDPAFYSAIDADAALQNFIGVKRELEREGRWQHYLDQYVYVQPHTRRASAQGAKIDLAAQAELGVEYRETLRTFLFDAQAMVPAKAKKWKDYVRLPKTATPDEWDEVQIERTMRQCSACARFNINKRHACKQAEPGQWEIRKVKVTAPAWRRTRLPADASLAELKKHLRSNGFNPNSNDQMKAYMRMHKHPVGVNYKTKEDTADSKHLKKLVAKYGQKHPIYAHTIEIHKVSKALSTYVEGMKPDEHGFIHNQYVNSPSTERFGSRSPNLQNVGKRGDNKYAKRARVIFVSRYPSTKKEAA